MSAAMSIGLSGLDRLTGPMPAKTADPAKLQEAAQQFEALLLSQILHSAHSSDSGWLGSTDSASSSAADFAEEQLAGCIARQGGLGLGKLITEGLEQQASARAR